MSERIPTAEDIRLALIEVGYTHYEADDAIEAVKQRGIGIGHLAAQENMQASIGAAFREAKAEAWDEAADRREALLRDRIAEVLTGHPIVSGYCGANVGTEEARDLAEEIIDDLGLRVEFGDGREETFQRVVGKWER